MLQKKRIPECLNLALEVCFQRDEIPHTWSRSESEWGPYIPGDLYCEADLTDQEWYDYLAIAEGERQRVESDDPDMPVLPSGATQLGITQTRKGTWAEKNAGKLRLSDSGCYLLYFDPKYNSPVLDPSGYWNFPVGEWRPLFSIKRWIARHK